jgi:protease-4
VPPRQAPPPPPRLPPPPQRGGLLGCAFALSFLLNIFAGIAVVLACASLLYKSGTDTDHPLTERHYSGNRTAPDKVAVVSLDGVIMEGLLNYAHKQINQAAHDDHVKAVVLRINSPGGSITASDDLHRRLVSLRDGDPGKKTKPKPLYVSMGSVAASGGYYVAMPGKVLFAEPSTITGSVGVYASLPNVKQLADTYGVKFNTIKAGEIKDSGSPFGELTPKERQVWQDMVDDAYLQFLQVVEKGRPALAPKTKNGPRPLLERFEVKPLRPDPKAPRQTPDVPYTRYRADGGIFTADRAKELGLVDQLGGLDGAIQKAAEDAELGDNYRAIKYRSPSTLLDLLSSRASPPPSGSALDPGRLRAALTPRVWYLAPGHEAAGILAAAREP